MIMVPTVPPAPKPPTPEELLARIRELNPHGRYARYASGSAIGEWIPTANRFAPVYERWIDGRWVSNIVDTPSGKMIRETFTNGESLFKPENWIE